MMTTPAKFSDEFFVDWKVDPDLVNGDDVWGTFLLCIDGIIVGDWTDKAHLMGCRNWIEDFLEEKVDRYEENLFYMNKEDIFRLLVESVFGEDIGVKEVYKNTHSRFHLTHIGMSSFDRVFLVLVQDRPGNSHFVWQTQGSEIQEAYFKAGKIESEFRKFLAEFKPFETSRIRKIKRPQR